MSSRSKSTGSQRLVKSIPEKESEDIINSDSNIAQVSCQRNPRETVADIVSELVVETVD